jgi:cell division septation protein DedD
MPRFDQRYYTPRWRTFCLLTGFAVLVAIGVFTVLLPSLESEPAPGAEDETEAPAEPESGALQE